MRFAFKVYNNFAFFVLAVLLSSPVFADGYQTCSIASNRVVTVGGKEQPRDAAYKKVCQAILPPSCRNWVVDKKPCAVRACVVDDNLSRCPNGEPAAYVAKETHVLTKEEMAAMNNTTTMEAQKMAGPSQGTNQAQVNGYETTRRAAVNGIGGEMGYK